MLILFMDSQNCAGLQLHVEMSKLKSPWVCKPSFLSFSNNIQCFWEIRKVGLPTYNIEKEKIGDSQLQT